MTLVKSYNNINPDSSSFTDYISLEFPAKSNHDCCIIINQSNVFCEADHRRNKWIYMEMEKAGKGSEGWGSCGVCCVMRCKPWLLLDGWMEVLKSRSCPALPRKRSIGEEKWQYVVEASSILLLFLTRILQGPSECAPVPRAAAAHHVKGLHKREHVWLWLTMLLVHHKNQNVKLLLWL